MNSFSQLNENKFNSLQKDFVFGKISNFIDRIPWTVPVAFL